MGEHNNILTDSFGREHTYLRISLTELCNLRCTYCMPAEGICLTPKENIMTYEEIFEIAKVFVEHGVTKIRLTGGEPFVRKDVSIILEKLATLPIELAITTNAVTVDRHIEDLKSNGIRNINISLDTLDAAKFEMITRRNQFHKVYENLQMLASGDFNLKVNAVLMKGFNEDEIVDFVELTKSLPISMRFIEFMPFDGNQWNIEKMVSYAEIMEILEAHYQNSEITKIQDAPNDTSKNYKINGYKGSFAIISSVTNPFCDSCNRLRLTANGQLKNCLFSSDESDLLTMLREGKPIEPIIAKAIQAKKKIRGGMDTLKKLQEPELHTKNRSMISIGG